MASCLKLLSSIDQISIKYHLFLDRTQSFTTPCGGIWTLVMNAVMITLFFFTIQSSLSHDAPDFFLVDELLTDNNVTKIDQRNSTFKFAFRVENLAGIPVDDRTIFDYQFVNVKYELTQGIRTHTTETQTPEKCKIFDPTNKYYTKMDYGNFFCVPKEFSFGGSGREDNFDIPIAYVKACDSSTEAKYNIKCATSAELQHTRLFFATISQQNIVDFKNFTAPLKTFYEYSRVELSLLSPNAYRQVVIYDPAVLRTDVGSVFEELIDTNFYNLKGIEVENYSTPSIDIEQNLASIEFYQTYNLKVSQRKYSKIQDGMAFFYVFQQILQNLIRAFYDPYLYSDYLVYAFSKMFKFEIDEDKEDSDQQRELMTIQGKKVDNDDQDLSPSKKGSEKKFINADEKECYDDGSPKKILNIMSDDCGLNDRKCLNQDLANLIDYIKKPRKVVKIEHCDITGAYPCCISKKGEMSKNERWLKMELIRNAEKVVTKRMNVMDFQKLIDRYEVVENLILDEKQSWMFNNRQNRIMVNKSCFATDEARDFEEEKNIKKKQMISKFIKNEDKTMSKIDEYSYLSLDEDIKTEIEKM